jgi:LCP family protein required for cell wall assembly
LSESGVHDGGMTEPGAGAKHVKPKRRRGRRILKWTALGLALVLVTAATAGFFYYRHLQNNIDVIPPDHAADRPDPGPTGPLNILILGSDERVAGGGVLGASDDLSDTTILLHLSADRSRAYGVSVPRDLLVDRPVCSAKDGDGADVPAEASAQFNEAYELGGPNCTWRTFEKMTGMRADHIVVVKFDGFKRMVDALGGVPVCVPEEIDDPGREIYVPAGSYDITGDEALDYVRARYGIGDGTDIGRIKRQQAFLAAMTNKAVSLGTLVNPVKLVRFLEAVTESIQTDPGLADLGKLRGIASQLKSIGLSNVKFLTMPIAIPPEDVNRRVPGPGAPALWQRIKNDQPLTRAQLSGAIDAGQDPDGTPSASPGTPTETPTSSPTDDASEREAVGLCA